MSYFKSIKQDIVEVISTSENILSGETWVSDANETFGINGIQVIHSADANCSIYLDQSFDTGFTASLTVTDEWSCLADEACSRTIMSVSPYFRVRVMNTDFFDTTQRRTGTAMTPIINPLPRTLSEDGRLMVESHMTDGNDRHAWITGQNEQLISPVYRLVGTSFGTVIDPNFWDETDANGGSITFDGEANIFTSTNTAGSAKLDSVRKARFVPGSANKFAGAARLTTPAVAGNLRRFGAYDDDNGFFYQVNGETFGIGYRKDGTDTIIESGSFNGDYGPSVIITTAIYKFIIEYGTTGTRWFVNDRLLHKVGVTTESLTETLSLPIRLENTNSGSAVDNGVIILNTSLFRMGELKTNPTSKWIDGPDSGIQLKYGAGMLHRVINLDNQGTISIYDGTSTSDTQLAFIDCTKVQGSIDFDIPFSDGLFLRTTDNQHSSVTVYE